VIGVRTGAIRKPDARFNSEVRAPFGVISEEIFSEGAEDGGIERIDVVW
jgi:hypothetical protein